MSGSNNFVLLNLDYLSAYQRFQDEMGDTAGDGVTKESEALNLNQDLDFPSPTDQSYGGKYYSVKILFLIKWISGLPYRRPLVIVEYLPSCIT